MTVPLLAAPDFYFGIADTWMMPVTYRNPANSDGTPGAPIDLTGMVITANVYFARQLEPVFSLTVANGGLVVDEPNGLMTFTASEFQTADATADPYPLPTVLPPYACKYPNRIAVIVRDSLGRKTTIAVFLILVFDPRTVAIGNLPQNRSATVVSSASQGPAGASGSPAIATSTLVSALVTAIPGAYRALFADMVNSADVESSSYRALNKFYAPPGGAFEALLLAWLQLPSSPSNPAIALNYSPAAAATFVDTLRVVAAGLLD